MTNVDVHQHLWTPSLVEALRSRREPPFLDGWTLFLHGEPPYEISPDDHDIALRREVAAADGLGRALVSLSAPIGVEWLPASEARPVSLPVVVTRSSSRSSRPSTNASGAMPSPCTAVSVLPIAPAESAPPGE